MLCYCMPSTINGQTFIKPVFNILKFTKQLQWLCSMAATSLPDAKPSKLQYSQAAWYLGTGLRVYRTAFAWSRGSVSGEDLPVETNGIGDSRKKFDRDRITLITGNSSRVPSSRVVDSRQNLDANQSN